MTMADQFNAALEVSLDGEPMTLTECLELATTMNSGGIPANIYMEFGTVFVQLTFADNSSVTLGG